MSEVTEDTQEHENVDAADSAEAEEIEIGGPQYDDLNTPVIALVGIVSALVTFICIVGLQAAYMQWRTYEFQQKVVNVRLTDIDDIIKMQKDKLDPGYEWVVVPPPETGTGTEKPNEKPNEKPMGEPQKFISMPIDQAMKVVAEKYEAK